MSHKEPPMICPACGAVMNHHATKIDYTIDEPGDDAFDGVLQEVHTCPNCGRVQMQRAEI